jgi:cell division septation protein DedD
MEPVQTDAADPQPDTLATTISIAKVRSVAVAPRAKPEFASLSRELTAPAATLAAPARGMPPSTLQQQAENLSRPQSPVGVTKIAANAPSSRTALAQIDAQPTFRLRGPDVTPETLPARGGFEIQIGAYSSAAEAQLALATARDRAADLLADAAPGATPMQKGNRQLYRARFGGFSGPVATNTCQELRRRHIDCFVTTTE